LAENGSLGTASSAIKSLSPPQEIVFARKDASSGHLSQYLREEFSSDCTPILKLAKRPETIRFEFNEQRGCNSRARKPIQVDADSLC
jgi:hypothetical protein